MNPDTFSSDFLTQDELFFDIPVSFSNAANECSARLQNVETKNVSLSSKLSFQRWLKRKMGANGIAQHKKAFA